MLRCSPKAVCKFCVDALFLQDAIGAIGIARCFTYGGAKKRVLYDFSQPPRLGMTKDEYMGSTPSTLNHFYEVRVCALCCAVVLHVLCCIAVACLQLGCVIS